MTLDPLLQNLPVILENKPELFSIADLQNLLETLVSLEKESPEKADQILREWCKARRSIRNALRDLASDRAEVKNLSPSQANDAKHITNFFPDLSQQVKDKLEKLNQNQNKQ